MPKLTLDMNTFKALASDTRLEILRTLDGKNLNLREISKATNLNKATLHEHLTKLNEAGLVKKKEREGHKWVYYKLTWKGEGLLHPENTRIVVMFAATFISLAVGITQMLHYVQGKIIAKAVNLVGSDSTIIYPLEATIKTKGESAAELLLSVPNGGEGASLFRGVNEAVTVPLANQTTEQLSQAIVQNFADKAGDIVWSAAPEAKLGYVNATHQFNLYTPIDVVSNNLSKLPEVADGKEYEAVSNGVTETASNVPSTMVAIVHDPLLQWIAIACIVIAGIILSFAIWRYWKNRKPKL